MKAILLFLVAASAQAATLSVDDYLNQVQGKSPNYQAAATNARAFADLRSSANLIHSPFLFANYNNVDDHQEYPSVLAYGTSNTTSLYTIGLGINTPVGLNAKYSYNLTHGAVNGANSLYVPVPNYFTSYNKLELTQSLVRNGFGSENRARYDQARWGNEARSLGEEFRQLTLLAEAEQTYWRLALARQTVLVQKDALSRSDRLLQWAKRRVNMQLSDRADYLQAQANYDLAQVEVQRATEDEKTAARAFNLLRNIEGESVAEAVTLPGADDLLKVASAKRTGSRLDVKAAEAQEKATVAEAQLTKETVKPTVDILASVAWNGRDASRQAAISEAMKSQHSTKAIGLILNVPLALGSVTKSIRGVNMLQESASYDLEQKRISEIRDWRELNSRLSDARSRLQLLQKIEATQRDKYENEHQRLLRGRTTTYQAVTFEQDYAQAQLLAIRTKAEVLQILSQLKLFRGNE